VKDAARTKEHAEGIGMIMIITKKHEGAISKVEKLLRMWMEAQTQKHVQLRLMMIQAQRRSN
jgi:hypothetical protein